MYPTKRKMFLQKLKLNSESIFVLLALCIYFGKFHTCFCNDTNIGAKSGAQSNQFFFGREKNRTLAYTETSGFSWKAIRLCRLKSSRHFMHGNPLDNRSWIERYPSSSWSKIFRNIRLASGIQTESTSSVLLNPENSEETSEHSVHLQLYERAAANINPVEINASNYINANLTTVMEYILPDGTTYMSLGTNRTRFSYFLQYKLGENHLVRDEAIVEHQLEIKGAEGALRTLLLDLWESGRLLAQKRVLMDELKQQSTFQDLLMAYTKRVKIRSRENTYAFHEQLRTFLAKYFWDQESAPSQDDHGEQQEAHLIRTQLEDCYFDPALPDWVTRHHLKNFLHWFRKVFPYYYDKCMACQNTEGNIFLGYVHPTGDEAGHQAGRTELYYCGHCNTVSRFARYNTMAKVLETRQGRCGEYSVLMLQFLEALGYEARWVVDWADHVWVEAQLGGRWVHLDPCEAAVDKPLLYEDWGKNQTYIMAFTPQEVQDVTASYTSNFDAAKKRRDIDEFELQHVLHSANMLLRSSDPESL